MESENREIFKRGNLIKGELAKCFSGDVWLEMLVPSDSEQNCPIGNVTFSAGCINNWHSHPGGQILLVTGGVGWYCEEGKPARKLIAGDVVKVPENVRHWHGAAKDSTFTHISIETNTHKGGAIWQEPVNREEYDKL